MTARCDLSDLPVDMRACRVHAPTETPGRFDLVRIGPVFEAQYPGRCSDCDQPIREGDWIQRTEDDGQPDGYAHEECR